MATVKFEDTLSMDNLREATSGISAAFSWKDSPQGYAYWHEVWQNLVRMKMLYEDTQKAKEQVEAS